MIAIEFTGKKLQKLEQEKGGHRIQRIPPTEKRDRVHTSTVTVAVMGQDIEIDPRYQKRDSHDFYVEWFSGTGKGGQKRNKSQSCCRLYHLPTGLVETRQGRSRQNNQRDARIALEKLLDQATTGEINDKTAESRRNQVGSGMRGDKIRTYRFQDDIVTDHNSGKTATVKQVMKGTFDLLWR